MKTGSRTILLAVAIAFAALAQQGAAASEEFARSKEMTPANRDTRSVAREELGRRLFFDPMLSRSGRMSCATCHQPDYGFSDRRPTSLGDDGSELERRTPTLVDIAWAPTLFWDGRASSLEEQALGPITAPNEMGLSIEELLHRVRQTPDYVKRFAQAYPGNPIDEKLVASAIAAFERTIVSGHAPFDDFIEGSMDAISESARRGFALFDGKARCSTCHSGWRLTNDSFHDIGLPGNDLGRGKWLPEIPIVQHAFKTPTLRNVAIRPPYMHDGSLPTLEAVVRHYAAGSAVHRESLSPDLHPIEFTDAEVADLVEFLRSLTERTSPAAMGESLDEVE